MAITVQFASVEGGVESFEHPGIGLTELRQESSLTSNATSLPFITRVVPG